MNSLARLPRAAPRCNPIQGTQSRYRRKHTALRRTRATPEGDDKRNSVDEPKVERHLVESTVQELRAAKVDKATATEIVNMWKAKGIKNPEQLRNLYRKQSNSALVTFFVQRILDAGACYAAASAAISLSGGDEYLGKALFVFVFASISLNYGISFLSNSVSMAISLKTMYKFGTNAAAYLEAMKSIAGPMQLDVVQSTIAMVDGYKVAQALDGIDEFLKDQLGGDNECLLEGNNLKPACTIDSLAIYLTLSKARELYDFDEAELGLTAEDASDIAQAFAHYDLNDDFKLNINELEKVFADAGRDLTRAEAQAAMNAIDGDGNGFITFLQFAKFWKNPKPSKDKAVLDSPAPVVMEGAGSGLDGKL